MAIKLKDGMRSAPRKNTTPIQVSYVTSVSGLVRIARNCQIVEASTSGLLLEVARKNLIPAVLRTNLNLDCLIGDQVFLRLEDMNLEISGVITRSQLNGKKGFHIAIDFTSDSPEYWRECLIDLLPGHNENLD